MDEEKLDRMFRRLVQNIRNGYPEYLSQPFEVGELFNSLIPYRHNRRELEIETNEDYEIVLCRLLAGEHGLLGGDDVMRETIREELASPNPNTSIYREFAASRVALAADAVRRVESPVGSPETRPQPRPSSPRVPASPLPSHAGAMPPQAPGARPPGATRAERASSPQTRGSGAAAAGGASAATATATTPSGACRFCGGVLPPGRRVVFCPHCGQNLAIQRCPACGSELELDWKFCVTCGRSSAVT